MHSLWGPPIRLGNITVSVSTTFNIIAYMHLCTSSKRETVCF